ncbi:MAG TPA: MFS transporter [Spirochaetota bacterium]|nr:MFS transporter [Spirochaetota bacterium]
MAANFKKDLMYYKFCLYGFLKNLNFFEPFLVLFFLEKGFSFLQIGVLYSIQSISTNILEIPTGIMADAMGRRRTMIYSMVAYLIAFVIYYFSSSFIAFVLAAIFMAFGEAFRTGTHKAMIFEYLKINNWKDQKVHYYGNTRAWSQMGSALSALIAGAIVFYSGTYKYVFIASTIPYVIDLFLLLSYPKDLDGDVKEFKPELIAANFKNVMKEFFESIRNHNMIRAIVNTSTYSGYFDAVKDYLQPVLKTFALSLPFLLAFDSKSRSAIIVAIVYFILNFLTSFASKSAGGFTEKFKNIYIPMNLTIILGLSFGVIAGFFDQIGVQLVAIILFVLMYLVHNIRRPIGEAYITDAMKNDILATALSTESQVTTLVTAILAPLIGLLADKFGIGIGVSAVSLLLLLLLPLYFAKHKKV